MEKSAYLNAKMPIQDGLSSMPTNLGNGNMWSWELAAEYGNSLLSLAFWLEYKGSMAREVLDLGDS